MSGMIVISEGKSHVPKLNEKKTMTAFSRTEIRRPDGSGESKEKRIDYYCSDSARGGDWFDNDTRPVSSNEEKDHTRKKKMEIVINNREVIRNADGTEIIKEEGIKTQDSWEFEGTNLIAKGPAKPVIDKRAELLISMKQDKDMFEKLAGNKNLLIGSK